MGLGGDSESEEASSQSWPETEIGEPATPPSPEVPVRRTFSHYTQVFIHQNDDYFRSIQLVLACVYLHG